MKLFRVASTTAPRGLYSRFGYRAAFLHYLIDLHGALATALKRANIRFGPWMREHSCFGMGA